jgi:multiple sugar transport system substrate-binding protein
MNRRIPFLSLLVVLTLVMAACGPNTDEGDESEAAPESEPAASAGGSAAGSAGASAGAGGQLEASGDIFAYGVSYETSDEIAQGRVDHFSELYPDVNVSFSESGFESQGFLTALQSDDPPDVVRIPRTRLGTYVARGVIEPLDDCISRAGLDLGNYREAAVGQVTIDGSVYAMPEFFWVTNWLIDNELFEQAGLDPATWDVSNWDEISAANDALLAETETLVGVDPKVSDGDRFPSWVWAAGGAMLSEDGTESLLDSPEVAEALEFTKSIIDAHGGHVEFLDLRGEAGADFFGAENQFVTDTEGAFPMQQWYLNVLAGDGGTPEITALPFLSTEGEPLAYAEGDALAVTSASDNKDAACAFVTTMVSTDAWLAAQQLRVEGSEGLQTGTSTANIEADEQIFGEMVDLADNPTYEAAVNAFVETLDSAFAMPPSPAGEEFEQAWQGAVTAVLNGEMEAAEALAQADEEAQAAIDGAGQ